MRGKKQRKPGGKTGAGAGGDVKSRILYAAAVFATLAAAVTHDAEFPRFLLGFEILLAAALYVCVRTLASGLQAEVRPPSAAMRRESCLRSVWLSETAVSSLRQM